MKLVFLDVDGVLNREGTIERFKGGLGIEPSKVALINYIIEETDASVILSSYWRLDKDSYTHIAENVRRVIGATKHLRDIRGAEVREFMERPFCREAIYAIIDDDSDFYDDQPLFKTSFKTGITPDIAKQVIVHLNTN